MDDLSILIKIGGELEKSFQDAIRAAQSGLSGLNAAVSKEMAEAGRMNAAASREMAEAGRMYTGTSREMAAAGRMGASAFQGMATEGQRAALSSENIASAGKGASSTLREMAIEGKKAADAVKSIASTGKVTPASIREISSAMKGVTSAFKQMSAQSKRASSELLAGGREMTSLSTELAVGERGVLSVSRGMATAGEMAGAASKGFLVAGAAIAATVAVAATAGKVMKEVGEYSVQVGMEFETAMSDAAATASASTEDFAKMEQAAMEMGKTTSKTASESAKALEYMSLAGWDVDTSISALPSVLKMSEASGMDLGRTSDLVTDSMAALGVSVNELPNYLDVATKAQTKSNQSSEQLMEAYIGVGGTMKNLNVPIEESATALGVLANRGIKGSEAGNALNAVMVNLTTGTGQAGKMMQELGISAFDSQGNFIGLEETLKELNTALQGYSEEEQNAAIAAIGGKQHMDALNDLMAGLNTTNEEGISEWAALTNELENCSGSLQTMRDMKLDNLKGDMETLKSATQDAGIKIYKHLNTPLRDFAQFGTQAVYQVSDALESDGFSGMAGAAGSAIADGLGMVMERLPEFLATATVSVASFLVGFAADLPASLLTGIAKGTPRLLKALPGLGVDIVKAIIRGILSMGSAPLKAIKSLIFGGWNDKGLEKTGANAATDYAAGIKGDIAAADIPKAQQAPVDAAGIEGASLPASGRIEGIDGQVRNAPGIAGDTAAITKSGGTNRSTLRAGAEQMAASIPMDIAQPADEIDVKRADVPVAVDVVPALQASKDLQIETPKETGTQTQVTRDALFSIPTETLPLPSERAKVQASIDTEGMSMEAPPMESDTAGKGKNLTIPPIDAVQDIALTPSGIVPDIPAEVIPNMSVETKQISSEVIPNVSVETKQISSEAIPDISFENAQISSEVVSNMPMGTKQISSEVIPDVPMEMKQISPEFLPGMVIEAAQIPVVPADIEKASDAPGITATSDIPFDAATAATAGAAKSQTMTEMPTPDFMVPVPKDIRIGDIQIPAVGIDRAGIGGSITQDKDAVPPGIVGNLNKQTIQASGIDIDATALSSKMGAVGALSGQAFMNGIRGVMDASQSGVDKTGSDMGGVAQMTQIPLQGALQAAPGETLRDVATNTMDVQDVVKSKEDIPRVSSGMKSLPNMVAAQESVGSIEAISTWVRGIADMCQTALRIPDLDTLSKRSVIDEILDILSEKRKDPDVPASLGRAPQLVYSPTFNIESSGDVKEDVEKANRMGMREFGEMMEAWQKQNKRVKFG